jgi:hypothetical protein
VKAAAPFSYQGIFQPHFQPKILPGRGFGGRFTGIIELCLDYNYRRGASLPLRGDEGPLRR